MNNQVRTELLAALRKLRDEGPRHSDRGICNNILISSAFGAPRRLTWAELYLRPLWERWPHYSGMPYFPVPHPRLKYPAAAEDIYFHPRTLHWSRLSAYGRLRWALLDWLIEQLADARPWTTYTAIREAENRVRFARRREFGSGYVVTARRLDGSIATNSTRSWLEARRIRDNERAWIALTLLGIEGPIRERYFQQKGETRQRVLAALRHTEPKEAMS
ncbi:MAG: hypothetical protein IPK64_20045 [bacterium]|nr:hypothetical protein [bacterium]